jgi:DMSO reductase anchor subunit
MLGVESVCGQWAEWLTSVPLIVYMTIAVEDKLALDGEDYIIIGSCVGCILFGFLMNFSHQDNNHAGLTLLFLSFAAIGVTGICLSNIAGEKVICQTIQFSEIETHKRLFQFLSLTSGKKLHTMGRDNAADNKHLTQRLKMKSIARLLLWVFPFFGIIYILGWRKVLERDGVFVGECSE